MNLDFSFYFLGNSKTSNFRVTNKKGGKTKTQGAFVFSLLSTMERQQWQVGQLQQQVVVVVVKK